MRVGRRVRASAAAIAAATALVALSPSASASDPLGTTEPQRMAELQLITFNGEATRFSLAAGTYADAAGVVRTFARSPTWVCTGTVDNPHYSSGAGGVIAKIKVNCTGPTATLPVHVYALLGRTTSSSVSTLQVVAATDKTQFVTANSSTSTVWWVPDAGMPAPPARAYFRASATAWFDPPMLTYAFSPGASAFLWVP